MSSCELAEGLGSIESDGAYGDSGSLRQFRGLQQIGVVAQEGCDCFGLKTLPGAGFAGDGSCAAAPTAASFISSAAASTACEQ